MVQGHKVVSTNNVIFFLNTIEIRSRSFDVFVEKQLPSKHIIVCSRKAINAHLYPLLEARERE